MLKGEGGAPDQAVPPLTTFQLPRNSYELPPQGSRSTMQNVRSYTCEPPHSCSPLPRNRQDQRAGVLIRAWYFNVLQGVYGRASHR